jgi:hypothetical protein
MVRVAITTVYKRSGRILKMGSKISELGSKINRRPRFVSILNNQKVINDILP